MDSLQRQPKAWTVQREPDGTLRMRPTARSTRIATVLLLLGLLACAVSGALVVGTRRSTTVDSPALPLILFLLGAALMGGGFWGLFVRDEWRVGRDFLEVRRRLFGYRRVYRYRAATLKLVHSTSVRSARRLLSEQMPERSPVPTDRRPGWLRLYVLEGRRLRCLRSVENSREEALRPLGEFLAEHTGWPLLLVRSGSGRHHGRRGNR